ncbi:MAG TPA: hypothetical protein VFR31_18265, partial [Thermoanaerobaculia bacterium]|nr:hypothetical protein [Thermoanaerobaculia bacterium]
LAGFVSSAAPTQAGSTSAHKWSVDQRLRARFDSVEMERRLQAIDMVPAPERGAVVVDGSKNPELLLPTELFGALLKQGFTEDPEARKAYRERVELVAGDLGIGPELWPVLKEVASDLLPSASRERQTWEEQCRSHFEALAAAREAFGEKAFDRMLYEAVAPGLKVSATGNGPELEQQLRDMENGCRETSRTPGTF